MNRLSVSSDKAPTLTLLVCVILVASSTAVFPYITGYGTQLFQGVALGAWGLLAAVTTDTFADRNHLYLWPLASILNVIAFSIVALPAYFILRRRSPAFSSLLLLAWLVFYVSCLFVLFPATDGP